MTCRREVGGCGYEFCWICLDEWKKHGTSWYKCDFKKDTDIKKEEEKIQSNKKFLERLSKYAEKYMDHKKGQKFARQLLEQIQGKKEQFMNKKHLAYAELKFIDEAIYSIIDCRRMLQYSYVLGYYLRQTKEIDLYEHHQYQLDSLTDKLHEILEQDEIPKLLEISQFEEFNKSFTAFKEKVINLSASISQYRDNLLRDFEGKMDNLIDYDLLYGKKKY